MKIRVLPDSDMVAKTAAKVIAKEAVAAASKRGRFIMAVSGGRYPILNRSRRILWLATGAEKAEMLIRLQCGDGSVPAGRVR
jgi:6-phosphogluconolactonase/glucosamine-6-phosphate isomerase/deaminase